MILHPAVIALLVSSVLICLMVLYASYFGLRILMRWDLNSGSELQLSLERRTYLVSTVLAYAFGFQLVSLFLFIFTAENLHTLFVGAMCAAGTLYVNPLGYPALVLKVAVFLLAGLWLIVNYADNRAWDYPLIKKKYALLLLIAPVFVAETVLQGGYLLMLRPDVITSCCGTLFSAPPERLSSGASFPGMQSGPPIQAVFYPVLFLVFLTGFYFFIKGKGGYLFSGLAAIAFPVSIAALIAYASPYFYELPTHCCPFCILQGEYGYVGYPIYLALLGGSVTGMGVGALMPFRGVESLRGVIPSMARRLALVSVVLYLAFAAFVAYGILTSNLLMP